MHGRCRKANRCHHNLAATLMGSKLTLFVFPFTWSFSPSSIFNSFSRQFLYWFSTSQLLLEWPVCIFFSIVVLLSDCHHYFPTFVPCMGSVTIWWSFFYSFSYLLHLADDSLPYLRWSHFGARVLSLNTHSEYFIIVSLSSCHPHCFFVAVSLSPFLCRRCFIAHFSLQFLHQSSFKNFLRPHFWSPFFVHIYSCSIFHLCSFLVISWSPFRIRHFFTIFHQCFFVNIFSWQSDAQAFPATNFPVCFHRSLFFSSALPFFPFAQGPFSLALSLLPSPWSLLFLSFSWGPFLNRQISLVCLHHDFFSAIPQSLFTCRRFFGSLHSLPLYFGVQLLSPCCRHFPSSISDAISRRHISSSFPVTNSPRHVSSPFLDRLFPSFLVVPISWSHFPSPVSVALSIHQFPSPLFVCFSSHYFSIDISRRYFLSSILVPISHQQLP